MQTNNERAGITQDSTLNKLIMLFVFDKMETAMTESTLLDLCTYKNNWIDFTNCKQTLYDMLGNGFIYRCTPTDNDAEDLYDLTTEGRVCLNHFYARIPSSVRQVISDSIKQTRIDFRRRQDYVATYKKRDDGSYDVVLRIDEATKTILKIEINVISRNIAKQLERTWQSKAPVAYSKLDEILLD